MSLKSYQMCVILEVQNIKDKIGKILHSLLYENKYSIKRLYI